MRGRWHTLAVIGALAAGCLAGTGTAQADRALLKSAQSWTYQLRGWDKAIASSADVVVVDQNAAGSMSRLKQKPGGGRRAALAYIAIGEAEPWRPYWKSCCAGKHPDWLTDRTQGWAQNYIVKFWDPAWKAIVKERIAATLRAGFDGLYLDRVDTWERMRTASGNSRAEMIKLVKEVVAYARSIKPDTAILVQNGEELLSDPGYLAAIDGVAKESLLYSLPGPGRRNSSGDIAAALAPLKRAKAQGKAILVVEYINGAQAQSAAGEIRGYGFVPNFAQRGL